MTELSPIGQPVAALPRFIGFATDAETRKILGMAAAACGWAAPEIREGGLEAAADFLAGAPGPLFLVLDLSGCPAPLRAVDALADLCPAETRVLAVGTQNDVHLYRGLRALGVGDYLLKPVDAEVVAAAIRAGLGEGLRAAAPAAARPARGDVIAFIGARGGAGTTALAIAAAHLLAEAAPAPESVLLLDLDLHGGTVAFDLETEPCAGLATLLESPDRVDEMLLNGAARLHRLGFRLLAAEEPMERQIAVRPESVQALLAALAAAHEQVLVDLPRRLDRSARSVLRTADRVVTVAPPTLAGLRDAQRLSALLAGLRAGQRPLVVLNRAGASPADLPEAEFAAALGAPVDLVLRDIPQAARRAAGAATSLAAAARGRDRADLRRLAALLAPRAAAPARRPAVAAPGGLLAALLGRRAGGAPS